MSPSFSDVNVIRSQINENTARLIDRIIIHTKNIRLLQGLSNFKLN